MAQELLLKYGCNPNQKPARVFAAEGSLPFAVLNGQAGYIYLLDAMNGWQLVRELRAATGLPAAASFKHVSPAGTALGLPLSAELAKVYRVDDLELSPLACAYARARGADRMSSYGDFVALSDTVDVSTARLLSREVSDGIIAPAYEPEALEILKKKKKGAYTIIQIDSAYEPAAIERREVFGITFEQGHNTVAIDRSLLGNVVSQNKDLPEAAVRDLIIALITLKYTQSNSVCYALDGQTIGIGAGQQSRIHCTRLAGTKADNWFLRQHPAMLGLDFLPTVGRADRDNAVDQLLQDDEASSARLLQEWPSTFASKPVRLTPAEKAAWLKQLSGVSLGSDAFFPFDDNIERAAGSGVRYVAEPGGSIRDDLVIDACDRHGMVLAFTGLRLFHH